MSEENVNWKDIEIQSELDSESYGMDEGWLAFVMADLFV